MEIKLFQRIQRDLASSINELIDKYWRDELKESYIRKLTQKLYEMNESNMGKDRQFTANIRQQCEKKRLDVLSWI